MKKGNSRGEKQQVNWKRITLGAVVSLMISFIAAAVIAVLIGKGSVPEERMQTVAYFVIAISAFMGSFMVSLKAENSKLQMAFITASCYGLLLLMVHLLLLGGEINHVFTVLLIIAGSATAAGLISAKGKGISTGKKKRFAPR